MPFHRSAFMASTITSGANDSPATMPHWESVMSTVSKIVSIGGIKKNRQHAHG